MLDTWNNLLAGFVTAGTPINLMWAFVGCALGTAIGVLPGLGRALGPGHHVAQHQPALGVGVEHLDRLPAHRRHDVTGTLGIAVGHVLDEAEDADGVHLGLAGRKHMHQPGDGSSTAHVTLHVLHAACRLDRDAAGVEADALADQGQLRMLGLAPVEPDQPRRAMAGGTTRKPPSMKSASVQFSNLLGTLS